MIKLTAESLRAILPRAPQAVIDAFVTKQDLLTKAGINATRARMAYFFANIEHECGGFTIPGLTENIRAYTAGRMAQVWPNRFPRGASSVIAKYGSGAGWQTKAFDDIYGNRMGNRPGTSDGSTYIGRGGPQWTGRDGYAALQRLTGLPAVANPSVASRLDMQPEICTAFWTWKNLNHFADAGDFVGCVKVWNGGTNGLADRQHLMAGNDPIIKRLETVNTIAPQLPEATKPAVTKADVAKGSAGAVVVGTVVHGAHQGWGPMQWALAVGALLAVGVVVYFGLRWWKAYKAAPVPYHDKLLQSAAAVAERPAPVPAVALASTARRAPRKRAAKQAAVRKRGAQKRRRDA
jgi:predicted chitinase